MLCTKHFLGSQTDIFGGSNGKRKSMDEKGTLNPFLRMQCIIFDSEQSTTSPVRAGEQFGDPPDLRFLLDEDRWQLWLVVVVGRLWTDISCMPITPIPGVGGPGHFPVGFLQRVLQFVLEDHPEITIGPECSNSHNAKHPSVCPCCIFSVWTAVAPSFFWDVIQDVGYYL